MPVQANASSAGTRPQPATQQDRKPLVASKNAITASRTPKMEKVHRAQSLRADDHIPLGSSLASVPTLQVPGANSHLDMDR